MVRDSDQGAPEARLNRLLERLRQESTSFYENPDAILGLLDEIHEASATVGDQGPTLAEKDQAVVDFIANIRVDLGNVSIDLINLLQDLLNFRIDLAAALEAIERVLSELKPGSPNVPNPRPDRRRRRRPDPGPTPSPPPAEP